MPYCYGNWKYPEKSSNQEGRIGLPFTGLTLPHFCTCSKPGPRFPTSYVVVSFHFVVSE